MGNNPEAALWIFANQTSINVMGHKMNDVQYSLYSQNKCVHYLHIYISTYLSPHSLFVHCCPCQLQSAIAAIYHVATRAAAGQWPRCGGRHAMHHANLILIDCAGGFLPSICQFANVCFYINLRLGELLANYEASWGQILAPSQ